MIQNVLKSDMKKARISPIWGPCDPVCSQMLTVFHWLCRAAVLPRAPRVYGHHLPSEPEEHTGQGEIHLHGNQSFQGTQ